MARWLLVCLSFCLAVSAHAQDRRCSDDDGNDRCTAEAIAAQDQLFGLKSIAELNAEGAWVRRAVYIDGYGRDLVAISFVRARGADPIVEIRQPSGDGASLIAPLDPVLWQSALDQSEFFDRDLVERQPPPSGPDDEIIICAHGWVMRVESSDPERQDAYRGGVSLEPPATRTKVQSVCEDGLAASYAWLLADMALQALPICRLIDEGTQRNNVTRLAACLQLSGDRVAAARAYNAAEALDRQANATRIENEPNYVWRNNFAENARFMDQEAASTELDDVPRTALRWLKSGDHLYLLFGRSIGMDRDTVEMEGAAVRTVRSDDGADSRQEQASFRIRWTQRLGRAVIQEMSVGAFVPIP